MKKPFYTLLVIAIFCVGFFLRFYQLGNIPHGLYPDETAIGYNAYSILMNGKDEYGASWPLYFRSFDDYKLPVYIYSTALSIKLFGANAFAVRFFSALMGSLAIVGLYFLVLQLSQNKKLAALCSFFLALTPWHIFFSRAGYEVNVATSFILFGVLFFVMAIQKKNNFWLFLLSIVAFLISLYTYNVTRLISPLFFFMLLAFYYKPLSRKSKTLPLSLMGLFILGMLPFFVTFISLQSQPGFSSHQDALIIGQEVKAEIIQTRSYFVILPGMLQKLMFNYWILVAWKYIQNLVSFFSTSFFFVTGADHPNENIYGGVSMFYYFELPLLVLGTYWGIRKRVTFLRIFYLWFLLIFLVGSIIKSVPNGTRTYLIVIPFSVFSAYGMYWLLERIYAFRQSVLRWGSVSLLIGCMLYSYMFYLLSYFIRYPVEAAVDWRSEDERTVAYIMQNAPRYDKIIFDDGAEFFYTSLLFYGKITPGEYQKEAVYKPSGLVTMLAHAGKFEFRKVDWQKEATDPHTLFITGKDGAPVSLPLLMTINYPTRPVSLYYDRKIGQFPTTLVAYKIYQSQPITRSTEKK